MNLKSTPHQHTYLGPIVVRHRATWEDTPVCLHSSLSFSQRVAVCSHSPSTQRCTAILSRVHVQNCTRLSSSSSSWSVSRACNRVLAFGAKHLAAQPRTVRPSVRQSLLTSVSFSSPVVHLASKNKPRRCLTHSQFLEYTHALTANFFFVSRVAIFNSHFVFLVVDQPTHNSPFAIRSVVLRRPEFVPYTRNIKSRTDATEIYLDQSHTHI